MLKKSRSSWVVVNLGPKFKIKRSSTLEKLILKLNDNYKYDKYIVWLANQYIQKNIKVEDLYKIHADLELFDKFKQKMPIKDINQIKTPADLLNLTSGFANQKTSNEIKKDEDEHMKSQAIFLVNNDKYKVVIPRTVESSCYFGRNTRWCTAASQSNNQFEYYSKQGPLIIILLKKENQRFQFHFESDQFMDEKDEQIDLGHFIQTHSALFLGIVEWLFTNTKPESTNALLKFMNVAIQHIIKVTQNPSKHLQMQLFNNAVFLSISTFKKFMLFVRILQKMN